VLLGEALAERASKKKQLEQLEARAVSVARYQEGEQPSTGHMSPGHALQGTTVC
jgi:hypothetical protein